MSNDTSDKCACAVHTTQFPRIVAIAWSLYISREHWTNVEYRSPCVSDVCLSGTGHVNWLQEYDSNRCEFVEDSPDWDRTDWKSNFLIPTVIVVRLPRIWSYPKQSIQLSTLNDMWVASSVVYRSVVRTSLSSEAVPTCARLVESLSPRFTSKTYERVIILLTVKSMFHPCGSLNR